MSTNPDRAARAVRGMPRWPLFLIGAPAAVAVWSGWVGLGGLCGFGPIHPLPGIVPGFQLNTAITLPVGIEAYGSYALGAWLRSSEGTTARSFGRNSAIGALILGMLGQAVYHILAAMHATRTPWPVVVRVVPAGGLARVRRRTRAPAVRRARHRTPVPGCTRHRRRTRTRRCGPARTRGTRQRTRTPDAATPAAVP